MDKDLMGAQNGEPDKSIKEEIVNIALEHDLMTQYTSFVAVEKTTVTVGGHPKTVAVPVEMPEGVSYEGVFGEQKEEADGSSATNSLALKRMPASAGAPMASLAPPSPAMPGPGGPGGMGPGAAMAPGMPGGMGGPVAARIAKSPSRANARISGYRPARERPLDVSASGSGSAAKPAQPADKLAKVLRDLIKRYNPSDTKTNYSIPGKLMVKNGKVEVNIWIKAGTADASAKLAKLGFTNPVWLVKGKVLIGQAPVGKLEEIAKLQWVLRIYPLEYMK